MYPATCRQCVPGFMVHETRHACDKERKIIIFIIIFIKPPLATARAASCNGPVHLFVCFSVCRQNTKAKQFRGMVAIDEVVRGLFKEPIIGPLKCKILKIDMTSFFSAEGGPTWIKFHILVQNDMSTAVIWSKSNHRRRHQMNRVSNCCP